MKKMLQMSDCKNYKDKALLYFCTSFIDLNTISYVYISLFALKFPNFFDFFFFFLAK